MHKKTVVNWKGKRMLALQKRLKTQLYHNIIKVEFILELCKRHELQIKIKNLVLTEGKVRTDCGDVLKKCKGVHFFQAHKHIARPCCRWGGKTRCHRRHSGRCRGPSLSTARELVTTTSRRLIMSTNRATWTSPVWAAWVERQTGPVDASCWGVAPLAGDPVSQSEGISPGCRCPFTVLLSLKKTTKKTPGALSRRKLPENPSSQYRDFAPFNSDAFG